MIGTDYNIRLRDTFRPGGRMSARTINSIASALNGMRGEGGISVRMESTGIVIYGGGGMNLSKFAFGWSGTSGQAVTIAAGYMEGRYGYRAIAGAVVNVGGNSENKHLIIVTGNENGGQIRNNSVLESAFNGDTDAEWRRVLYRVYLRNGRVVLDMVGAGVGGIVL